MLVYVLCHVQRVLSLLTLRFVSCDHLHFYFALHLTIHHYFQSHFMIYHMLKHIKVLHCYYLDACLIHLVLLLKGIYFKTFWNACCVPK